MSHDPYAKPSAPVRRRKLRVGRFLLAGVVMAGLFVAGAIYVFPEQVERSPLPGWAKPSAWEAWYEKGKVAWDETLQPKDDAGIDTLLDTPPDADSPTATRTAAPEADETEKETPTTPAPGLLPVLRDSSDPAPPPATATASTPGSPKSPESSDALSEALAELTDKPATDGGTPAPARAPAAEDDAKEGDVNDGDPDTITTFFGVDGKRPEREQ